LSSTLPLADIALICGFGDQSYFTRIFTRSVGASPGAWRRAMLR
jgi:AraC family transcriptional regulator